MAHQSKRKTPDEEVVQIVIESETPDIPFDMNGGKGTGKRIQRRLSTMTEDDPEIHDLEEPLEGGKPRNIFESMGMGLYEVVFHSNKPPPLSNAGVKFREAPVQWLRGLNLRSTRMAIGVYSESHILQLVFLILIFLDVTAVMGELLLYNVCTYTDEVALANNILKIVSLTILSTFLCQQLLLIFAFGLYFFTKPPYVLDFIIVTGAITLESTISSQGGGLVVLLMSWRIARVIHGFAISVKTEQDAVDKYREKTDRLRDTFSRIFSYHFSMLRLYNMRQASRMIQRGYLRHFIRARRQDQREILEQAKAMADPDLTSDEARKFLTDDEYVCYKNLRRQVHEAKNRLSRIVLSLPLFDLEYVLKKFDPSFEYTEELEQEQDDVEMGTGIHRSESMVDVAMSEWYRADKELGMSDET